MVEVVRCVRRLLLHLPSVTPCFLTMVQHKDPPVHRTGPLGFVCVCLPGTRNRCCHIYYRDFLKYIYLYDTKLKYIWFFFIVYSRRMVRKQARPRNYLILFSNTTRKDTRKYQHCTENIRVLINNCQ